MKPYVDEVEAVSVEPGEYQFPLLSEYRKAFMTLEGVQRDLDSPEDGKPLDLIDEVILVPESNGGPPLVDSEDEDLPELQDDSDDEIAPRPPQEDIPGIVERLFHEADMDAEAKKQNCGIKWESLLQCSRFDAKAKTFMLARKNGPPLESIVARTTIDLTIMASFLKLGS